MAARQSLDARHFKRKSWGSESLALFLVVALLALLPSPAARGHDGVDGGKEGLPGTNGAGAGPVVGFPKATAEHEDNLPAEALAHDEEIRKLLDTPAQAWAAKAVETPDEAPEGGTVLSRVDPERRGCRNIAEALRYIAGFDLVDDDLLPNLPVQGFFGVLDSEGGVIERTVGGQSVAFRAIGGDGLGNEPLPLSAVERIEIIRGSTSALHVADAFLGGSTSSPGPPSIANPARGLSGSMTISSGPAPTARSGRWSARVVSPAIAWVWSSHSSIPL